MKITLPNGVVLEGRGNELAGVLKRLNISLPTKGTNWLITEAPVPANPLGPQPSDPQDAQPSNSGLIRAEVRGKILPRLRDEGKYPGDPNVYIPILKDLAQRHGVTYGTAKASWVKCWKVVPA
ncbi:MAG: hypothetical protein JRN43_01935 [Nitrososphaerota archaeon]|nr:hypothetical protein [Nitrososphaerota archaeon]MDG7019055.1 hypothetical protein [Nitrososphaerota archaeon]